MANMHKKLRVMVGLSGGVDSAVSAALLKRADANVTGAFIKTWTPEWLEDSCSWREERRDAMRVAAHLDIPFVTIDLEKEYKKSVADYMIAEYRAGRTPNPDVMCNKEIKFKAFLNKALAMGADTIATGHYCQSQIVNGKWQMLRGGDESKDQSYFLWTLTQAQLGKVLFPVGHLQKSEVRQLATQFKLPVASKRDSQGICFLGQVDMKDFLSHYIKTKPGNVLDNKGRVIGQHEGAVFYTIGQRHEGQYVVAKDMSKNTVTVSPNAQASMTEAQPSPKPQIIKLRDMNWIAGLPSSKQLTVQVRYHGERLPCTIVGNEVTLMQEEPVAPGQSLVIYDGEKCLGGGVID